MIISSIIIIASLILDGLLSNFLPFMVGNLSIFTPLFTVVSIIIIYPFFRKREKNKYLITLAMTGLIYDLLYTNLLFLNMIVFVILGFCTMLSHKYLDTNFIMILIKTIALIILYQALTSFYFWIFQVVPVSWNDFLYLVEHTLLINIIYAELGYILIRILPKKYLGLSIN